MSLTVHLVPHSHMDLGWLWTFDQYNQVTESIISGVIYQLMANTDRKFAFAEMKFFQ